MSLKDTQLSIKFARKIKALKSGQDFWNRTISFYHHGKGFEHKVNPMDQARAPKAREWRRIGEGLRLGCIAKGKKEGSRKETLWLQYLTTTEQLFASSTLDRSQEKSLAT